MFGWFWSHIDEEWGFGVNLLTHAPILTTLSVSLLLYLGYRMARPIIKLKQEQIDLYKARLAVGSPDEAAAKFKRMEERIEELSRAPAKWGE